MGRMQSYLFGPVSAEFATAYLGPLRETGQCLAFNATGGVDLTVGPGDSWEAVLQQCPAGWSPDCVFLHLPYTTVPEGLLDAPVPVVGIAPEGLLLWHYYRARLPLCDAIITDEEGTRRAEREGLGLVLTANLAGYPVGLFQEKPVHEDRDVDLLFIANLNPAVQRERMRWLSHLATLGRRWKVVVRTGVFGEEYSRWLTRARIVFNHLRPGAGFRRVFEGAAAGALVLQEAGDGRLEALLPDGRGCVYFRPEEFEEVAGRYLEQEEERRRVVEAGRAAVRSCSFPTLWDEALERLATLWPEVVDRAKSRVADPVQRLTARGWQALCSPADADASLVPDLQRAAAEPARAQPPVGEERSLRREQGGGRSETLRGNFWNLAGLARACGPYAAADPVQGALTCAECFRQAVLVDPTNPVAATNLALALAAAGRRPPAVEQARLVLGWLDRTDPGPGAWTSTGVYPPLFDWFRLEWERAAWETAGIERCRWPRVRERDSVASRDEGAEAVAKVVLLRWRLHALLLDLTGDPVHAYEAFHARPDLPPACAALGRALARTGHPWEALGYLRQAVTENPLDRVSAGALYHVFSQTGGEENRLAFLAQQRLLHGILPDFVPLEDWLREGTPEPSAPVLEGGAVPALEAPVRTILDVVPASPAKPVKVSLSMIVKNEEANLPYSLGSVADLVDEVVIADTGSTDRTREIAVGFGARVVDFPWCDSFGAARNASLEQATGKWVLWLDGDDRLDEANRERMRQLFTQLGDEPDAYAMKVRSVLDPTRKDAKLLDQVRLFPNHPQIRWQYRIHEQILPAVNRLGGDVRWTDVIIDHAGYAEPELRRKKLLRNLRLLELEDSEHPDDPFTLFNMGWTTLDLGRPTDALPFLERSLARAEPGASIVRKLHVLLTQANLRLGRLDDALAACQAGRERCPEDLELLFEEALLLRHKKEFAAAEDRLLRLMTLQTRPYFASLDAGLRTYRARHLLGTLYGEQQKWIEAEAQLRAAVTEKPDFVPAWLALGGLYLEQQRWPALEKAAEQVEVAQAPVEAALLRARGHLARKDHAAARACLETVLRQAPRALEAWVLLSHVLLNEGKDWDAVEQTLTAILRLEPTHAEARHNLEVLHRQQRAARGS
jgi:tetratricopeptide (TPR) repeat protein